MQDMLASSGKHRRLISY